MTACGSERGQASPEYVGVVCLVALIAMAAAAINLGPGFAGAVQEAFCHALGASCLPASRGHAYGPALPLVDPELLASQRDQLLDPDPQNRTLELSELSASELAWLELNDPEAYGAAVEARSWSEQHDLLRAALDADLSAFLDYKRSGEHDPRMDYTDDGCSAPVLGSKGLSYDFTESCERHDFGYRNAKRLGVFDQLKDRIDLIFAKDMRASCEEVMVFARKNCRFIATAYYAGVRGAGGFCDPPGPVGRVPGPCAPERG
ncbi:MAG: phospholipase [Actinomycetota bacterium]|nr:phospholipase [Actinomycetota bacterium]